MTDNQPEALQRIEVTLNAILGIQVDQYLRETGLAKPRPRSVDRMLADFGLTGVQIASLLGKSPQAVSQVLARDKKPVKKPVKDASAGVTVPAPDSGELTKDG